MPPRYPRKDIVPIARRWGLRLIGIAIFMVIALRISWGQVADTVSSSNIYLLAASILLLVPLLGARAWRWTAILRMQGLRYPYMRATRASLVGSSLGMFTPGRVGDLVRAGYISRHCQVSPGLAISGVVLDRLFDLGLYLVIAVAGAFAVGLESRFVLPIALAAVLAGLAALVLTNRRITEGLVQLLARVLPNQLGQHLHEGSTIARGLDLYYQGIGFASRPAIIWPFLLSLAATGILVGQAYVEAKALFIPVSPMEVAFAVCVVNLLSILPVSIAGLGTGEAAIILVFALFGATAEQAVAFSLINLLIFVGVYGLLGAWAWLRDPLDLKGVLSQFTRKRPISIQPTALSQEARLALDVLSSWYGLQQAQVLSSISESELIQLSQSLRPGQVSLTQRLARKAAGRALSAMPASPRRQVTTLMKLARNPRRRLAIHNLATLPGTQLMARLAPQLGHPDWGNGATWALCLSHDVDDVDGWRLVPAIAKIDAEAGLKATFNFLAGADYIPESSVLEEIRAYGHEVGIHGWNHDLGLAQRSPRYIYESLVKAKARLPGAAGFRSPSLSVGPDLFRCLEQAGFQYDSSLQVGSTFYPSVQVCIPYRLPALDLWEVPLLVQDDVFFRDGKVPQDEIMTVMAGIIDPVKSYGGVATLGFHPHSFTGRLALYQQLACWMGGLEGSVSLTTGEAVLRVASQGIRDTRLEVSRSST